MIRVSWLRESQATAIYLQVFDGKRVEAIDRLDPFSYSSVGESGPYSLSQ